MRWKCKKCGQILQARRIFCDCGFERYFNFPPKAKTIKGKALEITRSLFGSLFEGKGPPSLLAIVEAFLDTYGGTFSFGRDGWYCRIGDGPEAIHSNAETAVFKAIVADDEAEWSEDRQNFVITD